MNPFDAKIRCSVASAQLYSEKHSSNYDVRTIWLGGIIIHTRNVSLRMKYVDTAFAARRVIGAQIVGARAEMRDETDSLRANTPKMLQSEQHNVTVCQEPFAENNAKCKAS